MAGTNISIALGITIGLIASCIQSLGLTIQRKSHVLNERLPEHEQRLEHRRPLWLLGFAIFISSNILGSLVQIASLPVVILAPLGAVSLLWNAFFARLLLGDLFSAWMVMGTLLIAGGAVLIAVFGIVPEPTRSVEDLLQLFGRPTFVVYFSLLGFVVLVSLSATHIIEYSLYKQYSYSDTALLPPTPPVPSNPSNLTTGVTQALEDVIPSERTPLLQRKPRSESPSRSPSFVSTKSLKDRQFPLRFHRTRTMIAISYASFSGILSGMCLLFAKSGVELLLLTLQGDNQFWRWESWALVLGLVAFALLQLWYLHKGLTLADPTLVCPSAFCFYNLSSIVNGLVYFDQFSLISPLHLSLVALGIIVLLAGVWVVSIHAGSGTSWTEATELVEEAGQSATPREIEAQATATQQSPAEGDLEWGTMSEPLLDSTASSGHEAEPTRLPAESSPPPSPKHSRSRTTGLGRPRPHLDQLHTTSRRRTSHNSPYFNSYHNDSHSLSPTLPNISALAGAGFQIGLSPVSPGFAIVPLDRRRRTSNLTGSTQEADGSAIGFSGRLGARRRTVSEGDVGGRAPTATLTPNQETWDSTQQENNVLPERGLSRRLFGWLGLQR